MDVLSFINSNTIRKYLKEIDYSFNPLEAAWIIYKCNRLSYDEKKNAWLELITEMPDCRIPKRTNCSGWDSLHKFLKEYIRTMDDEIETFYKEDPGKFVYMYSYLYKGDREWSEQYETVYPSVKLCMEKFQKETDALNDTFCPEGTGVIKFRIRKQSLIDTTAVCEAEYRGDGKIISILENSTRTEEAEDTISNSFDGLWFDIPTPFKKGDIVWVPVDENMIRWNRDGGFVLLGLSTWDVSDYIKQSGDNSDMNGNGYFVNEDGTVYREVMENYMDLEYYDGPYKQNEKILSALSKFVKGEIEVDLLLCAYRKVLFDIVRAD